MESIVSLPLMMANLLDSLFDVSSRDGLELEPRATGLDGRDDLAGEVADQAESGILAVFLHD